PFNKVELTGAKDLGGQIQVLQYKGDHLSLGYWYNWILYKDRFENAENRQMVKCGDSIPILWKDRKEGALLGYVDNKTEIAYFSHDKICETKQGTDLNSMYIIVRELKDGPETCECAECAARRHAKGPPHCACAECKKKAHDTGMYYFCACEECKKKMEPPKEPVGPRVMIDDWQDFAVGRDDFPKRPAIRALFKSLNTFPAEKSDQYVALWYQIAASFSWGGHEYRTKVGSIQVLFESPEHVRGFDYDWRPFPEAATFDKKEWLPVHVNHHKGDISPGVIFDEGKEILGKIDVRNERATYGIGGKEKVFVGPIVRQFKVLCRKARAGCKFD
ncbi:MFP2 proteinb, partial [Aphelenchoides avenae]